MHRKQDTINLSTSCCDIMVLANREADSNHPYTYARVIGIMSYMLVLTELTIPHTEWNFFGFIGMNWIPWIPWVVGVQIGLINFSFFQWTKKTHLVF